MATPAPSTGWPTPLPFDDGSGAPAAAPAARHRSWPPADWPTQAQLTYTKELITVILLVLALPWLVGKLATRPGDVLATRGRAQVGAS